MDGFSFGVPAVAASELGVFVPPVVEEYSAEFEVRGPAFGRLED